MSNSAEVLIAEKVDPQEIVDRIVDGQVGALDWGSPSDMIICLVGDGRDPEVLRRLNRTKGRDENKTIAVAGSSKMVTQVADISKSPVLNQRSRLLSQEPESILDALFNHPIGLILPARSHLVDQITGTSQNGFKTVMVAGQSHDPNQEYRDLYNEFIEKMTALKIPVGATSANPHEESVFSIYQQDQAYDFLRDKIDFFVKRQVLSPNHKRKNMTSGTNLDLTGERAVLKRWGSRDINQFTNHLGKIDVPRDVQLLPGAQISPSHVGHKVRYFFHSLQRLAPA